MLSKRYKSTVEPGYMCPLGLAGPQAVTLTKQLKYKDRLLIILRKKFKVLYISGF